MQRERMEIVGRPTRRRFLQAAATGAAASLAVAGGHLGEEASAAEGSSRKPSKRATPFRLGLASYTLRKFPLDETLAMTQRVALDYICFKSFHLPLDSTPDQIAQAVAKVKAAGITLYGGGVITMRNEAEVDRAFEYAKAAGMTTIIGVPAPDVLKLVNEKVQHYDIFVAIHNHGPGDKVYPTPESAYERVKDLDRRIGLCIDIGHTLRIGADPILDAQRFADRLYDVHIKDESEASPQGKPIEIGRGVIDIPGFLKTLVKIGYSHIVSFEYEKDADDPLPGLAESVGYVRGVLDVIG
jgi:inosose dehydratase